jgi:hypothetical protein
LPLETVEPRRRRRASIVGAQVLVGEPENSGWDALAAGGTRVSWLAERCQRAADRVLADSPAGRA